MKINIIRKVITIIFISLLFTTVAYALNYYARDIEYVSSDVTSNATNVQEALDELYTEYNNISNRIYLIRNGISNVDYYSTGYNSNYSAPIVSETKSGFKV